MQSRKKLHLLSRLKNNYEYWIFETKLDKSIFETSSFLGKRDLGFLSEFAVCRGVAAKQYLGLPLH